MAERKTRYFILGAAVVLVGGLCTGLVAYYRADGALGFLTPSADADLRYVPNEASVVAFADVRAVMGSELRQRALRKWDHAGGGKDRLRDETGIDVEKDVDSAVAAVVPGSGGPKNGGFVLLRGRFDEQRVEAAATRHGAEVEEYRGRRLFVKGRQGQGHGVAFAFVEDGALLVGEAVAVKAAIDRVEVGALGPTDPDLLRLIDEARTDATLWAVARPEALENHNLPGPVEAQIPQFSWLAASGRVNGGLDATFRVQTVDAEAARNLRETAAGVLAMARMGAANHQQWQPVIQSVEIGGDGTRVSLSLVLPLAVIDQLVGDRPDYPRAPPAPEPPPAPAPPAPPR